MITFWTILYIVQDIALYNDWYYFKIREAHFRRNTGISLYEFFKISILKLSGQWTRRNLCFYYRSQAKFTTPIDAQPCMLPSMLECITNTRSVTRKALVDVKLWYSSFISITGFSFDKCACSNTCVPMCNFSSPKIIRIVSR